jgi:hypothetical protein
MDIDRVADDVNSHSVANAAEQKVIRNGRKIALRISHSQVKKDCGLSEAFHELRSSV